MTGDTQVRYDGDGLTVAWLALTGMVMSVLTLGLAGFHARNRLRRYIWSRTFIDGIPLEYRNARFSWTSTLLATDSFGPQFLIWTAPFIFAGILFFIGTIALGAVRIDPAVMAALVAGVLGGVGWFGTLSAALGRSSGIREMLRQTSWNGHRVACTLDMGKALTQALLDSTLSVLTLGVRIPHAISRATALPFRHGSIDGLPIKMQEDRGTSAGRWIRWILVPAFGYVACELAFIVFPLMQAVRQDPGTDGGVIGMLMVHSVLSIGFGLAILRNLDRLPEDSIKNTIMRTRFLETRLSMNRIPQGNTAVILVILIVILPVLSNNITINAIFLFSKIGGDDYFINLLKRVAGSIGVLVFLGTVHTLLFAHGRWSNRIAQLRMHGTLPTDWPAPTAAG